MFDLLDSEGASPLTSEVGMLARLLAADAVDLADFHEQGLPANRAVRERLLEEACAGERLSRMAQARMLRAVAALVEELRADDTARAGVHGRRMGEFAVDQVAAVLGVSRGTAQVRIDDAVALVDRLPRTLTALEVGIVSLPVARVLVREIENTDTAVAAEVEARVLDALGRGIVEGMGRLATQELDLMGRLDPALVSRLAVRATAGAVRALARRALATLDAEAVRTQRERARADRDVAVWPGRLGMTWVGAELPDAQAYAVYERIDVSAAAKARCPGETRTMGQLRADLFVGWLLGAGLPGNLPEGEADADLAGTARVDVSVTIDRTGAMTADRIGTINPDTLTELFDMAARSGGRVRAAEIVEPACPGRHDEPGHYRPSKALASAVIARDVTCRFPGCMVLAQACDLDHVVPHPAGPTCVCNLCALCRHHHRLKTHGGWTLVHHGDGRVTWRDPTGRTYDAWPDGP